MTARRCLTVQVFTGRAGKRVGWALSPSSISGGVCGSNLTLVNRKGEGVTQISKGGEESEGKHVSDLKHAGLCVFDKPTTASVAEAGWKLERWLVYQLLLLPFDCL